MALDKPVSASLGQPPTARRQRQRLTPDFPGDRKRTPAGTRRCAGDLHDAVEPDPVAVPELGFTTLRPIVVASAPWGPPDDDSRAAHFDACFALASDAARALLQATGDLAAPLTRQQLWHWYLVVDEEQSGKRTATGARLFEGA